MKIKICKVCKLPVDQCQCSNKIKEDWKKEQARILHERIAYLDAEILRERELISHRKDMQEKIQRNRNALRYENNSFEIDDDIADVIFTLWEKGYDTRFCWKIKIMGYTSVLHRIIILIFHTLILIRDGYILATVVTASD